MAQQDVVQELSALLLAQQRMISELKTELEALKNMMFDHRPAFRDDFARQREKLAGAKPGTDDARSRVEAALEKLEDLED